MSPRRPAAFDLSDVRYQPDDLYPAREPDEEAAPARQLRRRRWIGIFASAAAALIVLAVGIALDNLIRALFARTDWLGWSGLALVAIAAMALVAMVLGEIISLVRLRRIDRLRDRAAEAARTDDRDAALAVVSDLDNLYRGRPETARGRAALARQRREIIDGRDLIGLAEAELLGAFDGQARRSVVASAKRVAVVTAVSPRAVVDLVFVTLEILRLIRRLATLYGGRPGTLGFLRLARATLAHLAVTGGMAAGDSIVQQVVGHGLAARLSARLGEGVINGLLTARIGIAAAEVCRPLPYREGVPPRLGDVLAVLRPLGGGDRRDDKKNQAAGAQDADMAS